jgi:hypothetical protein
MRCSLWTRKRRESREAYQEGKQARWDRGAVRARSWYCHLLARCGACIEAVRVRLLLTILTVPSVPSALQFPPLSFTLFLTSLMHSTRGFIESEMQEAIV